MKKSIFYKCMGCFYKHCKCNPAKRRISRKMKKQLVYFIKRPIYRFMKHNDWFDLSSCDMKQNYNHFKPGFAISKKFDSMILSFFGMLKDTDWENEAIYIDEKGRLCWYWESDSDYGGSSGIMPFCYNEKAAGKTWAFSEMHGLFYYLTKGRIEKMPETITNDKQLLIYFKNNPLPEDWID